jgi:hypothetical protein
VLVVPATGWVGVPVRIALALLFPLGLIAVGVVQRGEVGRVRDMVTAMGRRRSKAAVLEAEEEEAVEEEPVA